MNQVKNRDGQSSSCSTINDISETFDVQLLKNKTGLGFSIAGGVGTEVKLTEKLALYFWVVF